MARRTRIGHLLGLLVLVNAVSAAAASAAYPGANGPIFFAAGGDVWSVEPDGSGLGNLTDRAAGAGSGSDPSVSPDGTVAFVVGSGSAAEIWTMRADGSAARQVTSNTFRDDMPAISRDGSRIAFVTDRGGDPDVWTMTVDGFDAQPLLTAPGAEERPQYSPDGQYVVVATHVNADLDIGFVPATGGPYASATQITHHALDETAPALQPDQVRLAYTRAGDIHTAYYNGTDEFPLAVDPAVDEAAPAFSPDGTQVVYATGAELMVAAAGGLGPHPLPRPELWPASDPDWAVGAIDRTPPQTVITKRPAGPSMTPVRFRFRSSEIDSRFECQLDRRRFLKCRTPRLYDPIAPGRHRFRVRATDAAGNTDPTPAADRFRVARFN